MSASALRWWRFVVAIGLLNFEAFLVGWLAIGGDALNDIATASTTSSPSTGGLPR